MSFFTRLLSSDPPSVALADKLAALAPPDNMQALEAAFKDYRDPSWIDLKDFTWKEIWRLHLFGIWRLQRLEGCDQEVVRLAQQCFEIYSAAFERLAQLRMPTSLTYNPSLVVKQYLALSGMPWHLSQKWGLHTNAIVQEFLQKDESENGKWAEWILSYFGPDSEIHKILTPEVSAKLELFLLRNVAMICKTEAGVRYVTWLDLIEDWARGIPNRLLLIANLKKHLKLVKCGKLFTDVITGVSLPSSNPLPPAPSPAEPKLSRHGRGGSRIGAPSPLRGSAEGIATRSRAASQDRVSPQWVIENDALVLKCDPRTGTPILIPGAESVKQFLIEALLNQVRHVPGLSLKKLRMIFEARQPGGHPHRQGLSLQLFLEDFEKLMARSSPQLTTETRNEAHKLLQTYFPPADPLCELLENAIAAALCLLRIKASPSQLENTWQKPLIEACSSMTAQERDRLFAALLKVPVALPQQRGSKPNSACTDYQTVRSFESLGEFPAALLFIHFLGEEQNHDEALTRAQLFKWIESVELYLGIPLEEEMIVSFFADVPLPGNALTQIQTLQGTWRPDMIRTPLFLEKDLVTITLPIVISKLKNLLFPRELSHSLSDTRLKLAETLALATFLDAPAYQKALVHFKGLPGEKRQCLPPAESVVPVGIELKSYEEKTREVISASLSTGQNPLIFSGGRFGRHLHLRSFWSYKQNQDHTIGTFHCFLLLSPHTLKRRGFEVTLNLPIESFQSSPALQSLLGQFIEILTNERYIDDQDEVDERETSYAATDTDESKFAKIRLALSKFTKMEMLASVDKLISACSEEDKIRCRRQIIALFDFILEAKVKYRQLAYAFVDLARLPEAKRIPSAYAYEQLNPLKDGKGWTHLPLSDARVSNPLYTTLRAEIEAMTAQILKQIQEEKTEPVKGALWILNKDVPEPIAMQVVPSSHMYQEQPLVCLAGILTLPGGHDCTAAPLYFPRACSEKMAQHLIAMFLCDMKITAYKLIEQRAEHAASPTS